MRLFLLIGCLLLAFCLPAQTLLVKQCNDFKVTGKGDHKEWDKTAWVAMTQVDSGKKSETRFKILYSTKGIYVLFYGEDEKITSPYQNDFETLFNGDVFEVFFHPQPATPLYFEYEISPLDKELVLLIPNLNGRVGGWAPWNYTASKKTRKAVFTNGATTNNASLPYWTAEIFFPYQLLYPLENTPPQSGTTWRANFCRLDYDSGAMIKWSWSPIKKSFHEFGQYRSIRFE